MPSTRRRWIVRHAVMALVGVVLLVALYVSSWGALHWLMGRGVISISTYGDVNGAIYGPLIMLQDSGTIIISRFLTCFSIWCANKGAGGAVTFSELWQATGEETLTD